VNVHYPTLNQSATPEYVLAVLQDMHRQECQFDPNVNPNATLSSETTVAQWREACDLLGWRQLGRAHNEMWGINCSDVEWQAVFEPGGRRTLSDVCQWIASRADRPTIRPAWILGRHCVSAGAFLTIRSVLQKAGATAAITPSTPLAPFTRAHLHSFLGDVTRLAPGILPPVRIRTTMYDAAIWGMAAGSLLIMLGGFFETFFSIGYLPTIAGVLLFAFCYALTWYAARLLPTSVEFGELTTFRDLAVVVGQSTQAAIDPPTSRRA